MHPVAVLAALMPECLFDADLRKILTGSLARIRAELRQRCPLSAAAAQAWILRQNAPDPPEISFRRLKSHFLLIPWFLELSIRETADPEFQFELVYSSLNAYYFARLLDNVADGQSPGDAALLPMAAFFHYNFQAVYAGWFAPGSLFWKYFGELWIGMADATVSGSRTAVFADGDLEKATARKIAAVKIPVAAVCFRYGREDMLDGWFAFYDAFCCAHELLDDFCDCFSDMAAGRSSYLLSRAVREKLPGETMESYMIRAGLEQGYAAISEWLDEAHRRAEMLASERLVSFVRTWQERVGSFWEAWLPDLKRLRGLAEAFEPSPHVSG
ncbi:MAG TPA: hypothetical protein VN519_09945 [Bryobacteraceae bacterium]|nr:hypothetical protein [Bryobacteraceae bacterium]